MEIKRHVGKHQPTNTRAIITYPVIPNTTDSALIIHIDRQQPTMKDAIMRTLDTQAAQSSVNFGEVLGRTMYADSGKSIFQVLHESGNLKKVPIDEVEMWPNPSMPIPLRSVLIESGLIPRPVGDMGIDKFNTQNHNQKVESEQSAQIRANNLIAEAMLLEKDAVRKREEAYRLCPQMAPTPEPELVTVDTPPVDPASLLDGYVEVEAPAEAAVDEPTGE